MEEWKDIDNVYEVSSDGNVRTKNRVSKQPYGNSFRIHHLKSKILTQQESYDGYLRVKLYDKYESVSHLVANAFIPNQNNYTVVHHKDHNPHNNKVENLEWIDEKTHNNIHSNEKMKKVYQYAINGELIKIWDSSNECGRNGYSQSKIVLCCNGKRKMHKGYLWSYKPL